MNLFDFITEENFLLYASKCYDNPQCSSLEEFYEDLNRFKYLKRLIKRYEQDNDLQIRLILNHIVVIYNMFGIEGGHKLTFFKIERHQWKYIKPFLIYLGYLTKDSLPSIESDEYIVQKLKEI